MSRFSVLGFTEAELGFVIASLFVAVAAFQANTTRAVQEELEATRDSLTVARDSLNRLAAEGEGVSHLTPYCSERGETDQSIATIIISAADRYVIDGDTLSAEGVRTRLASFVETSQEKGCRFGIELIYGDGLSLPAWLAARVPLSRIFYFSN
jgi:hypothetical protein